MKEKMKLTKLEKSWILYDIGNSAFILLVSTLLPIYFNSLASGAGISESDYLAYWGYAGSVATILVAIIGPICGKGASFVGTTLVAVISQATEGMTFSVFGIPVVNTGVAVGSIAVLFVIGFVLFCKADKLNKARQSV